MVVSRTVHSSDIPTHLDILLLLTQSSLFTKFSFVINLIKDRLKLNCFENGFHKCD